MKEAKVFTRDEPVNKIDLHNCFNVNGRYADKTVVDAKRLIGDNAPKYLMREGLIRFRLIGGVDTYTVTVKGVAWLRAGVIRYMELHPDRAGEVIDPPEGAPTAPAKPAQGVRRTRPAPSPTAPASAPAKRVIRRTR